jgi:hypothetical protein
LRGSQFVERGSQDEENHVTVRGMEQKEKADKVGTARSNQLGGKGGQGNEKVREQRLFHEACDTAGGEAAAQGPRGGGGRAWVGSKIVKEFPPYGVFQGVITHMRQKQGAHMYHVVYEDGDSEDLALSQVLPLLAQASAAQGQARRPRRSKPSWTIPTPSR